MERGTAASSCLRLHHTRDPLAGAALVLRHLRDGDLSLAAVLARRSAYHIVKKKVAFPRERLGSAYIRLRERWPAADADASDGHRLAWRDRRESVHMRPSGTEPVVRLIAEAPAVLPAHR